MQSLGEHPFTEYHQFIAGYARERAKAGSYPVTVQAA